MANLIFSEPDCNGVLAPICPADYSNFDPNATGLVVSAAPNLTQGLLPLAGLFCGVYEAFLNGSAACFGDVIQRLDCSSLSAFSDCPSTSRGPSVDNLILGSVLLVVILACGFFGNKKRTSGSHEAGVAEKPQEARDSSRTPSPRLQLWGSSSQAGSPSEPQRQAGPGLGDDEDHSLGLEPKVLGFEN